MFTAFKNSLNKLNSVFFAELNISICTFIFFINAHENGIFLLLNY